MIELGHDKVFMSCSALKQVYRDRFIELQENEGVKVIFIDLQVEEEELLRRMRERGGHYMKEDMVESQMAIREEPGLREPDVLPGDAGKDVEEVTGVAGDGLIGDVGTVVHLVVFWDCLIIVVRCISLWCWFNHV